MPVGWYGENGGFWAMSPGYDAPRHNGFRREVSFSCMFCHNGYPEMQPSEDLPGRDARFKGAIPEGIDCQRCHGPGGAHVEAIAATRSEEEIRESIMNPADLPADRQLELCMQCHLETTSRRLPHSLRTVGRGAFSYRPGEPLADYILHFDRAPGKGPNDGFEIAHAAYRLQKSACFQETRGAAAAMTCTTCHDPHDVLRGQEAVRHYLGVCEGCHEPALSRLAESGAHTAERSCLDCHMPKRRTDDVVHAVMTDHYIQRRKPNRNLLAPLREDHSRETNAYRGEVAPYYPNDFSEVDRDDLYLAVAQVKEESNLSEGIERLAEAIEEHRPQDGDFYFQLAEQAAQRNYGVALATMGREAEALAVLERLLNEAPEDPKALNNLGEVLLTLGRYSEARDRLHEAIRLDPDLPEAYNNLALAERRLGRPEAAMRAGREALRIQPDYPLAHNTVANLLLAAGRAGEAERHYKSVVELDPDYAEGHYNYAGLLADNQRFDEAEAQLREAVRLDPGLVQAQSNLGTLLARQGQLNEAMAHFRKAIERDDWWSQWVDATPFLEGKMKCKPKKPKG